MLFLERDLDAVVWHWHNGIEESVFYFFIKEPNSFITLFSNKIACAILFWCAALAARDALGEGDALVAGGAVRTVRVVDAGGRAAISKPVGSGLNLGCAALAAWDALGEGDALVAGGAVRAVRVVDAGGRAAVTKPVCCGTCCLSCT